MSEINHSQIVQKILEGRTSNGTLKSRESATVEFKQSFNKNSTAKYAKTLSAFANNHGGYIIFGVKDSPRELIGLTNNNFDNLSQEQFTEAINALFAPSIDWEMGTLIIDNKKVGWIYAEEAEQKPLLHLKEMTERNLLPGTFSIATVLGQKKLNMPKSLGLFKKK